MANIKKQGKNYLLRAFAGYDINGKQIVHSMTWKPEPNMTEKQAEKEAKRQAILFEEKCKNGQYITSSIKFIDFSEKWITEYAEKQLKAKTIARYKELLKRINIAIGHMKLDKIQPTHLMQFYNNLAESGIRANTSYYANRNLKKAIDSTNLSKTDFAKKANISYSTFHQAYTGKKVAFSTANKIASVFECDIMKLFQQDKSNTTLSPKTIQHYHRLISSIMQTAVQWQIISSNPCNRIKPPKVEQKESRFLDDTEVLELFHCLDKEPIQYKTMITLLIYTGMRRGEICGLKWSDIDFHNKTINIQRAVLYLPDKGIFEDSTKTSSSQRIIKVADTALQLLKEYKKSQNIQRLQCGDQWQNMNYIFTQWNGKPIHPDSLTAWFKKFIIKYNLPSVSIHSLRHTNASLLIANGVNITTVSKRLGHSNTATTAQIYAHAIRSADEVASDTLQNLLKNNG